MIRDTTRNLVESLLLDVWPRAGAIVDFGLKSQQHYEALYYPVRDGHITPEQLDAALGNGPKLTELVNAAPLNPHKGIEFRTDWDGLMAEPESCPDSRSGPTPSAGDRRQPWPSELAEANRQKQQAQGPGREHGQGKGKGHDNGHSM